MAFTLVQERVTLRCGHNVVSFHWPLDSDVVTVTQSERPGHDQDFSVQEAHDLFWALLNAGAY